MKNMFATQCSEAGRDERRDGRDDREDLVRRRSRAVAEPHGETDEAVAEHTERDRLDEAQIRLRRCDRECLHADRAAAELVLLPDEEDPGGRERAHEISEVDDRPVARNLHVRTRLPAHAITIRLLPVKSSAPATMTRIRPSENASPPRRRRTPNGTSAPPAVTVVAKIAPSAMKAPASIEARTCSQSTWLP